MVDMTRVWPFGRSMNSPLGQQTAIARRMRTPCFGPFIQVPQFDAKNGTLNPVHAVIEPLHLVLVPRLLAPASQQPHRVCMRRIIRDGSTPFPVGAKVLARIEAETADVPNPADPAASIIRAMRLARILDDGQIVAAGNSQDGIHVGRLPE